MTAGSAAAPQARFLDHIVEVDKVPARGLKEKVEASESERRAIADALDLAGFEEFEFSYVLAPLEKGRFSLTGRLSASVTQTCVVTLDPIPAAIAEEVDLQFWPPADVEEFERGDDAEIADVGLDGPEPIADGIIDVGQLAYEILASALDPYPRKHEASFEWNKEQTGDLADAEGAFAALRSLKRDLE